MSERFLQFVRHEARLLDEARWDEWLTLFAPDGHYWVPLSPEQTDPLGHNSLAYEDTLLLRLRVERLKEGPFSQHPRSRSPARVAAAGGRSAVGWTARGPHRVPVRGGARRRAAGACGHRAMHHLRETPDGLRIVLKRIDLLSAGMALPSLAVVSMTVAEAFRRSAAANGPDRPLLCILPETAAAYGIAAGEISYAEAGAAGGRAGGGV